MPGRDPFEGFKLYCRPEIAQNPVAAFERARCYKDGLGVRKNKLRAQDEYRRAIKLRDSKHKSTVVPAEPTSRIPLLKENGLKSSGGSMHTLNLNSPPSQESKMDNDTLANSESDSPLKRNKQKRGSGPLRLEDYFATAQDDDGEEAEVGFEPRLIDLHNA
mmetsp:Transcript_27257/g.50890  ORF Transcript_27257/g.50890 Transcript_27257/m.50890 type:complete len:161 (+) Transcript_27257:1311-1793(+)